MLFNPGELNGKEFKFKTIHNEAGEQVALWYACQSSAFGAWLWNMAIARAYGNQQEIETALEREMLRLARLGQESSRDAGMKSMITRSGLFIPNQSYVPGTETPTTEE